MLSKEIIELRARGTVELQELSDRLHAEADKLPTGDDRTELMRRVSLIINELLRRSEARRKRRRARQV